MESEIQQAIRDLEDALARIVLYTVREAQPKLPTGGIISVLRGSVARFVLESNAAHITTYGELSFISRGYLADLIERMIYCDLLETRVSEAYKTVDLLHVTDYGLFFFAAEVDASFRVQRVPQAETVKSRLSDDQLYERLRKMRLECAQFRGLPAYMICHNASLKEIASVRPATPDALRAIKGIGAKFVQNYGVRFLRIIAQSSDTQEYHVSPQKPDEPNCKAHDVELIRRKHPNAYRPWTPEEDERLRRFFNIGMNLNELVEALGRQTGGIRSRLKKLGLSE